MKRPTGSHSVPKDLKKTVEAIKEIDGFSRLIVGSSKCTTHSFTPGDARFTSQMQGGIRATGYHTNGITKLLIYCSDIGKMSDFLSKDNLGRSSK